MRRKPDSMPFCSTWPRLAAALFLLPAGCVDVPVQPSRIERLSAEVVEARLPQPVSTVSLDDIVTMSRAGMPPEEVARRIDAAHARYRLSATQIVELQRQGVALAVLDHMVAAERHAVFEDVAADIARHDQACRERIVQEQRQCRLQSMAPFWPHPISNCWPPYPGYPYWRCF